MMDYTSTTIRGLTDAAFGRRPLVIADDSKMTGGASVHTLKTTARELGLDHHIVQGKGEDGNSTSYLIAGLDGAEIKLATAMIAGATYERKTGAWRDCFQRDMGELLGYSKDEINSFIGSDVALECPCACCGG